MSFDSPLSLGGAVSHFGQPPGEVAFGRRSRAEREGKNPSKSLLGGEGLALGPRQRSSLIYFTTVRGNGGEDIRENCA